MRRREYDELLSVPFQLRIGLAVPASREKSGRSNCLVSIQLHGEYASIHEVPRAAKTTSGVRANMDYTISALERVDNDGQRLWQSPMSVGGVLRSPRFFDTDFYFTRVNNFFYYGFEGAPSEAPTSRYALSNGSLGWEGSVPYLLGYSPRLALDRDNGALITFLTRGDRTLVRKHAAADGTVLGSKFVCRARSTSAWFSKVSLLLTARCAWCAIRPTFTAAQPSKSRSCRTSSTRCSPAVSSRSKSAAGRRAGTAGKNQGQSTRFLKVHFEPVACFTRFVTEKRRDGPTVLCKEIR